jgi:lysophospholipase L1-like esterase
VFFRRVLLLIVPFAGVVTLAAGNQPPADPDPNRFAPEIKAFAEWDSKNSVPAAPMLFVGSSSIRMWRTHEAFPSLPVINRGFGGSHISDVIHFADRVVLPYRPQVIVFYAGDNDIAGGKSAQRVFEDYRRFVGLVHAGQPAARIVFVAIKPSGSRWSLWPEMKKTNRLVRDFCRGDERLTYADLNASLLGPEGTPDPTLFLNDRLHLNARGYALWTGALAPILQKVLASAPSAGSRQR